MFGLGIWELVLICFILLLLFGAKRLPDIAAGLGGAMGSFKRSLKESNEVSTKTDTDRQLNPTDPDHKNA